MFRKVDEKSRSFASFLNVFLTHNKFENIAESFHEVFLFSRGFSNCVIEFNSNFLFHNLC